ncbi:GNAT family N-acetyltransferase [Candidatus Bipolaricaulota bacterium]|nr:GNAT family N-acetyltransferase [Candidatus Bipolaricaulota bacterium]
MVTIREATRADEDVLRRLEDASPQGHGSRVSTERTTFFYRSDLFPRARVLLALERGRAVGVMAYALKEVFVGGEPVPVAYFYDLRSDPAYRRSMKRGLWELWKAVRDEAMASGARFVYGHVKGDNVEAIRVFTKGGGQVVGGFDVLLLPTRPGRVRLSPLPEWRDAVARVGEAVGRRDLRTPDVAEVYARGKELGYLRGVFRLERGTSFAQASVWDSSHVHRQRVLAVPRLFRVLAEGVNPLSQLLPLPRLPIPGQTLALWHVFDVMVGGRAGPHLLAEILTDLRHRGRAEGADLLALFHSTADPLVRLPRILLKETLTYHTVALPLAGPLPTPPLYLDIRDL